METVQNPTVQHIINDRCTVRSKFKCLPLEKVQSGRDNKWQSTSSSDAVSCKKTVLNVRICRKYFLKLIK